LIIDVMMVEGELDIASSLIIQCSSHFKYWWYEHSQIFVEFPKL
jgi:hypothetical protein